MTLSMDQWHKRYQQQSAWTQNLRDYIYKRIAIEKSKSILEIGSGTGVLLEELSQYSFNNLNGLDIDINALSLSRSILPGAILTCADAHHLPFLAQSFDVVYCHFLLLWVNNPLKVISEMVRVASPGGYILAFAEPDYGGRIDHPEELSRIGCWQGEALVKQGANPNVGRLLRSLFSQVKLQNIEVGLLGGQWNGEDDLVDINLEWDVIESDLRDNKAFQEEAERLRNLDLDSRNSHQRILYVPTFYAIGRVL